MNDRHHASARRLALLRAGLAERGLAGLVVTHLPNVRYLTGFSGSSAWLLVGRDMALFATDGRYEQQAQEELATEAELEVSIARDGQLGAVAERAAKEYAGSEVGFEARHLVYGDWEKLREGGAVEWTATTGLVEGLRAVKDDTEIEMIRRAADIAVSALRDTLPLVKGGVTERELAAELDYRMIRRGAEGPAFDTIVASGQRTALPHAQTSARRIRSGDLLLWDFGARWNGYCCDLTRTFVIGEPDARQTGVYLSVVAAHEAASQNLREGVPGREVDGAVRRVFGSEGLEDRFAHSTGHGLGLEVHESPRLSRQSEEALVRHMVVTVEPGLYFPGWGGVRIENDYVVNLDGAALLADLEYERLQSLDE
ncbi:MAG: aminopeptidase P family protein [Gemmatimonadota bacterium]|nr:MAG: aminopeptidase P family protein [Gemmatimonadota bacterium]